MDLDLISRLIESLIMDSADSTIGNRFNVFESCKQMPKVRLFCNSLLSCFFKATLDDWNVVDPADSFTAIRKKAIMMLDEDTSAQHDLSESDKILRLGLMNASIIVGLRMLLQAISTDIGRVPQKLSTLLPSQ